MADFRLKLNDNKVAEWNEYYIDYDGLKKILKEYQYSHHKYHELYQKHPSIAYEITKQYHQEYSMVHDNEEDTNFTISHEDICEKIVGRIEDLDGDEMSIEIGRGTSHAGRHLSRSRYRVADVIPAIHSWDTEHGVDHANTTTPTERTTLLSGCDAANTGAKSISRTSKRQDSIREALSSITDYLSPLHHPIHKSSQKRFQKYVKQLCHYVHEMNQKLIEFDILFHQEQQKVKSFYCDKLSDLEDRLEFVRATVAQTAIEQYESTNENANVYNDKDYNDKTKSLSPFVSIQQRKHHTKQSSSLNQRMEEMLHQILGHNNNRSIESSPLQSDTDQRHYRKVTDVQLGHLLQEDNAHLGTADDTEDDYDINGKSHTNDSIPKGIEFQERWTAQAESIKRSLISQYRTAKYLQNYAMLNITGFVRIAKKFDKAVPTQKGKYESLLASSNMMYDAKDVDDLASRYEMYYANWFCEGDQRTAKVQLLSKRGDGLEMDWSQLQLGYRLGMCAVLAVWVCWDCIWGLVSSGDPTIGARAAFPIFRACGGLLLLQWFWGCSVFIWTRYRVNYIFLFDLVPSTVSTPLGIFTQAVNNTLIFLVLMLLYYKSGVQKIPQWIPASGYPFALILITLWKLLFPMRQRLPMWRSIFKVLFAPLYSPTFFQTYVGDVLTSMVKILQDVIWSICWIVAGGFLASDETKSHISNKWSKTCSYRNVIIPLVIMMPLFCRFNQCLRKFSETGKRYPHVANAFKYALSLLVTLFGTFHPLYLEYVSKSKGAQTGLNSFYQIFWTLLFVTSSLYSFCWDVYVDWGLGQVQFGFLNQYLMYPKRSYYYFTIAIDLVLRFLWVLTLVPPHSGASFALPEYLHALSMMLELFRRTVWGFFRLENEHRNNVTSLHDHRADFVPLHFQTGHQHNYVEKRERAGSEVLREVILVAVIVGVFCFATIVAAQRANRFFDSKSALSEL